MDKAVVIGRRKAKHLAVLAGAFEREIQPRIPTEIAERYKALLRGELRTFADEAAAVAELDRKTELNDHAEAIRDRFEEPRRKETPHT